MGQPGEITVPIWGLIVLLAPFVATGIWALINMFFFNKASKERMDSFEKKMKAMDIRHDKSDADFNEKLMHVRADFEKEIEKMDNNLAKILEKQVETQTLVKLLVDNKIKTGV
jgi:hypothetical protein